MKKKLIIAIGSGLLAIGLAVAGAGSWESGDGEVRGGTIRTENRLEADFPAMAGITPEQAVQKASAVVPGRVLKTGLEDENGFLVYGVEMVTAQKTVVDVKVDAGSGKVLSMELDEPDDHEDRGNPDRGTDDNRQEGDHDSED